MKGLRGALAAALGLALMQLVLSSSQNGGKSAGLLAAGFTYPAKWVASLVNPNTPAIPDLAANGTPAKLASATTPGAGLSGTGTPAGTGSSLLSI